MKSAAVVATAAGADTRISVGLARGVDPIAITLIGRAFTDAFYRELDTVEQMTHLRAAVVGEVATAAMGVDCAAKKGVLLIRARLGDLLAAGDTGRRRREAVGQFVAGQLARGESSTTIHDGLPAARAPRGPPKQGRVSIQ